MVNKSLLSPLRAELTFEEHRFSDVRRRKIAEEVLNRNVTGIRVFKNTNETLF